MTDAHTLKSLLGEWVTVRNPDLPVSWYGRLIGLHDDPGLLLEIPRRGGTCLPQRFTVTAAAPPTEPGPDLLDAALAVGQRAEQVLERVRAIPRLPHVSQQTGTQGRAYTRGWESVIAMLDNALADCCVCGGAPVVYRNFKEQPFCGPCANCECGQDVCVRTRPDTSGGHVHTTDADEIPPTRTPPPTSTDTVRTRPDTDTADTSDLGVRVEYRATVRRDQVHLAIAEAFDVISRETGR
jgi:hypothetical protein